MLEYKSDESSAQLTRMFMGPSFKNLSIILLLLILAIVSADATEESTFQTELLDDSYADQDYYDQPLNESYDNTNFEDDSFKDNKISSIQRSPAIVTDDFQDDFAYSEEMEETNAEKIEDDTPQETDYIEY